MSKQTIALKVAQIAGGFSLLVSILLLLNFVQMRSTDPLENKVLTDLVERLKGDPNNQALIQEVRELDLLTRRAFFSSIWQVRVGGYLLLFGGIVFMLALRLYYRYTFTIRKPSEEPEDGSTETVLTQKWVVGASGAVVAIALTLAFTANDPLEQWLSQAESRTKAEEPSTVRVIEITDPSTTDDTLAAEDTHAPIRESEMQDEGVADETTAARTFPTERDIERQHNTFRGPWGLGVSQRTNIPTSWDGESGKSIKWKVEVPVHGFSSPVIWNDKLFLTGATQQKRVVMCFNRHTGELLWTREASGIAGSPATPPRTTDDTGLAAPTATTDGHAVYALFGTGDIIAFDMNGNRLWARNLGVPDNHYGHSASLILLREKLFVQYDTRSGSRVMALSVENGNTIWEQRRRSQISWGSPVLARVNGNFQLVLNGHPMAAGYNPADGRELWSVDCMSGEVGTSPAFSNGLVFVANEYATMAAIDPKTSEIVWETNHYLPEVSSPVAKDGLIFIATTYALIACFDALTGELQWEFDTERGFYSSPMIVGSKLYASDMDGITYVLEASRELKVIGQSPLGEGIFATPAFTDGAIYIRGSKHLYCIE